MSADPGFAHDSGQGPALDSDIARTAALIADPTRAAMLTVLLDGRPAAAGELARVAGVTAQTASAHLARLLGAGLVTVAAQGRHRYYRLSGPEVADVLEALSLISPPLTVRSLRQSRRARALREARTCYDHLAGRAGTALLAALLDGGHLEPCAGSDALNGPGTGGPGPQSDGSRGAGSRVRGAEQYDLTAKGEELLHELGIDVPGLRRARRIFAASCLDWTERRPHLRGALGAGLTCRMIEVGWFNHGKERRALVLTATGRRGLQDTFGCIVPETA